MKAAICVLRFFALQMLIFTASELQIRKNGVTPTGFPFGIVRFFRQGLKPPAYHPVTPTGFR